MIDERGFNNEGELPFPPVAAAAAAAAALAWAAAMGVGERDPNAMLLELITGVPIGVTPLS